MDELYVVESGVRRRAEWRECKNCSKMFLERLGKSRPKVYCSIECRDKARCKKVNVTCAACGGEFSVTESRKAATKSGLLFCSRACKDKTQKIGGIAEVLPSHYGTGQRNSDVYRRIYKEVIGVLRCERCGYCEFECGVDIHHKDNDEKNNVPSNLCALCSPCHRALHQGLWFL